MVNCKCSLAGIESGHVKNGKLETPLFSSTMWKKEYDGNWKLSSGEVYSSPRCGFKNYPWPETDLDNLDPDDMILCINCLKRNGYLW